MHDRKELAYGRDDWRVWTNTGSADVGPWELARVTGGTTRDGETVTQGQQPSSTLGTEYIVNGPVKVTANGGYGVYQPIYTEVIFKYDGSEPSAGDDYGPKSGQGTAVKDNAPLVLRVIGVSDSGNSLAKGLLFRPVVAIQWGKIQGTVTNQSGATHLTVSVKSCDFDGTALGDQTAFDVKTPLEPRKFTDLAEDDVVGYLIDAAGEKIIVTDCWATIDDGKPWVGLDDDSKLIHLHPTATANTDEADPAVFHGTSGWCSLWFDDAGHFIGGRNASYVKESPWGITDPIT